jgi:hypothetical protein
MNTPRRKPLTVLESPYRGWGDSRPEIDENIALNLAYARLCLRDSLFRGEAPIASHLLYTQPHVLDDTKASERAMGIACGLVWIPVANYGIFYTDRGWSAGMLASLVDVYLAIGFDFRIRSLEGKAAIRLPNSISSSHAPLLISKCED